MLKIFNSAKEEIGTFEDYDTLACFINAQKGYWEFHHHPFTQLPKISKKAMCLTSAEYRAIKNKLDLVTIRRSNTGFIKQQIVISGDIDVNSLKEIWCLDYCKAHKYIMFETILPTALDVPSQSAFLNSHPVIFTHEHFHKRQNLRA